MLVRFLKKAAGFFAGLGLIILAVFFSLSLALNTKDASQLILNTVNSKIPGTLSLDHLSVSLLTGSLDAVNLTLAGPDKTPLIYVEHVSFNLSWIALLFRTISIDDVVIDGPRVFMDLDEDNTLNLVQAFVEDGHASEESGETGGGFPFNIELEAFNLKNGSGRFSMTGKETVDASNIDLKIVDANLARRSGVLGLSIGPVRIQSNGLDVRIDHLDLAGQLDGERLSSFLVDITSNDGHVTVSGDIKDVFTHPAPDLTLDLVHENLSQLEEDFDLGLGLGGKAKIHAGITGNYDNPQVAMDVNISDARFLERMISSLELKASLSDLRVTLDALNLDTDWGQATATGTLNLNKALDPSHLFSDFHSKKVAYTVDLTAQVPQVEKIPYVEGIARGPATAHIKGRGQGLFWEDIRAEADVVAESATLSFLESPLSAYVLNGRVALKETVLSIDGANLKNGETRVDLNGEYRFDSFTYEADLNLESDDLTGFALIKPYGDYAGRLNVKTHWVDNGASWMGRLDGKGADISVQGTFLGDLLTRATLDHTGLLMVERCDAGHSDFSVHGKGRLGLFGENTNLDAMVDVIRADIPGLFNIDGANALVDGHVTLSGTWDDPRLSAMITAGGLSWEDLSLGQVTSSLSYESGRISFSDTRLTNQQSIVEAEGFVRVLDPETFNVIEQLSGDITVNSPGLFIEDFYKGLSGKLTLDSHVAGQWQNLAGHMIVEGDKLDMMGQAVSHVRVESRLEQSDVVVDQAVMTMAPGEDVRLSGRFSMDNLAYLVNVDSDKIALGRITSLGSQSLCQGKVALTISGQGTLENPGLGGTVTLSDVTMNRKALGGGEVKIIMADHSVQLDGNLIADVSASLDLDTYDFKAHARFDNTELGPFFRIGGLDELEGGMTGEIKAWGRLSDFKTIQAETHVSSVSVRSGSLDMIERGTIQIIYGDKTFQFMGTRLELPENGELLMDGQGQMGGDLSLGLSGHIPLSILNPVVEELTDISGDVGLRVKLTGSTEDPVLSGDMSLENVTFLIPEVMQKVHGVSGRIHAAADHVTLERLTGGLDRGNFDIRGRLNLDDLMPGEVALTIKGESLPFSVPDVLDVTVNTSMTFKGTPSQTRLEGTVMLVDGRYFKDVTMNLLSMVPEKSRNVNVKDQPILTPYLKNMVLDVSLKHRNPFDVDNNIAYLELLPDLKLYGTLNQPLISGRAQVGNGMVTYQSKEFEVNKGVVDFLNPYKIEPTLDIECETELRNKEWLITLSVSGTPDNLKFTLSSNPSESDADILSLLLFGKTTTEIREGGGSTSASAAQLLAAAISMNLEKNLKDATGMDIVKVEYSTTNSENSENGISVSIGKELSDRLTLIYEVENKDTETVQKAISEFKFLENLLINASQDTGNNYGAELVYRLEFR